MKWKEEGEEGQETAGTDTETEGRVRTILIGRVCFLERCRPPARETTVHRERELLRFNHHPALSLLHDPQTSSEISSLLRQPNSGAGDNNLCRWLYDTFQSNDPSLQLVVLRFIPTIAGLYLSRIPLRKPLAGFEAVLLALYAHETTSRAGQPVTVNVPDLSHPSLYHESVAPNKNNATALNLAVISPSLEPHGTVRSTRRARIVGVALELYYSKIHQMPVSSKLEFCEFCKVWAGKEDHDEDETDKTMKKKEGRIPLPWELLQPVMRILGHCMMGCGVKEKELLEAAMGACKSLYGRSLHDIDAKGILATESLIRLGKMALESKDVVVVDHTEISISNVISI
ncbi:hypothetical protein FEM48_Zijuj02G0014900 [Ziziphus jujuba var. spinosa]|uniref:Hyccin n=1 Tax=Ziziphus jujuba var. spinosa TaxID=714518 RepID=A0A978VSU1_ZIZJJ|nr:hypothetical protein FEM48_Zijuj02G0014900 [Ziziphus jujuba var. spinosa]